MSGVIAAISSGKAAFTPLSLGAALIEWWDARTSTYLTLGAGNAISNVAGRKSAYALTQATAALQPIWGASGLIKFDAATSNGDYLNLALSSPVAQGQVYFLTSFGWYKSGIANWTAVTHRINCADVSQIVMIDAGAITSAQRTALETYLGATSVYWCVKTLNTSIYNRIDNTPDVNYTLSYTGGNAAGYSLASSQAGATVNVGAQGLTAPVAMRYPIEVGADSTLQQFYCNNNQLTGSIPALTANTALQVFQCSNNQLTGSIPALTANTALQLFYCYGNQLTGSIPALTANTALQQFYCYGNQLTGSIPALTANTALQQFQCSNNQLTGSIPALTANTALQQFYCNNNQLTGSIPALTANTALLQFYCYGNQLTGSIPALTANTALQLFYCYNNQLTGSIPALTANTALQVFQCYGNQLTGYAGGGVSNTLSTFSASTNQLPAAAINAILADFVAAGRAGGALTLNGTGNAAPTGQGLTDKATLAGLGWTVTTN
jgi:Leucine-rich repeat (LRR) protein